MDRRGFTKSIVAAALGVRVADELLPAGPAASPRVSWPPSPVTDEMIADAAGGFICGSCGFRSSDPIKLLEHECPGSYWEGLDHA